MLNRLIFNKGDIIGSNEIKIKRKSLRRNNMKFENTQVMNFKGAFHGMRNPLNSWDKSDSYFGLMDKCNDHFDEDIAYKYLQYKYSDIDFSNHYYGRYTGKFDEILEYLLKNGTLYKQPGDTILEVAFIGPNDMELAQRLIKAGPEHRKFMRQIFVTVDIEAPIFW